MMNFQSFTNVRPTKELGCQVITAPTKGQLKLTPEAAVLLGVGVGDYVQIGGSNGEIFVVKGSKELGGGKVAASNKTGAGILTFSSAMSWEQLDGDENFNVHFDVDSENPIEHEGRTFYKLTLAEKVEKQKRKSKEASAVDSSDDLDTSATPMDESAPIAEASPATEDTTAFDSF